MSYGQDFIKELVGKKIIRLQVDAIDQKFIIFETDMGNVCWGTYADCCSETWFADITGVSALIGGTVMNVEEMEVYGKKDGRCRQEVDSFYGIKITTDKGYVDIVFRNSSNGYYGGNLIRANPIHGEPLFQITSDWQAGERQ